MTREIKHESDLLVSIAEKEIPFFFINHLNQPCVIAKGRNHYEVIEMNDDSFLGLLRQMRRNSNTSRITVSENTLKRARAALVALTMQLEQPKIKTHLRVAWKEKNKVLRYDLTNSLWQQVEISSNGVKIIDSKAMLDEVKEYKNSGYTKLPVFFQRYSNTREQVLPATEFDHDILDYYFKELTNVTDKRAIPIAKRHARQSEASLDNKSKVLIAKVLLISKYIADIPHFLESVIGVPGSMKTNYLKFSKRLVDPGVTEVHSPPIMTEDIHQKFAHNYYLILDNMTSIKKWLSDLICSVITGSGFESRKLYSNQGIVNMVLKSCVAVGSVNRVFTEPDALTRLIVQEFLEVNNEDVETEDVITDKFEEIRPQILGCIFDILSKAIVVKHRIAGKYTLGRMADVLEWGEVISQSMRYEEGEFLRAYNNLISIQQRHTSDTLMIAYQRLFHKVFEDPNTSNFYVKEREDCYKIYSYGKLHTDLNDIAEEEGKGKKWPKGRYQLTERSLEISSRLRKLNISLEITNNEFVLGVFIYIHQRITSFAPPAIVAHLMREVFLEMLHFQDQYTYRVYR
jgi:hypothetical protein